MKYFDANFNHDEIGLSDGYYCHRSCAEKRGRKWEPVDEITVPDNQNNCSRRGSNGFCVHPFRVVKEIPSPLYQHFI